MSQEGNKYDGGDSLRFIRENLPEKMQGEFSDDEIDYIVDLIYEFFDDDDDDSEEIDENELLEYVCRNAKEDKDIIGRDYTDEQIEAIVAGELAYCSMLNQFD
jgi:predicted Zn-dependent peptidase